MTAQVHSIWRSACGRYTVQVNEGCFQMMERLARAHAPNEVGTALSGCYSDDALRAEVEGLAPISPDSRGAPSRFLRGAHGLAQFFRSIFAASNGYRHYVGEWHSHPGGTALPSVVDDENMFAIARDPRARCAECVLLIVAVRAATTQLGAFVYSRTYGKVLLSRIA